jgi:hypothetical protein
LRTRKSLAIPGFLAKTYCVKPHAASSRWAGFPDGDQSGKGDPLAVRRVLILCKFPPLMLVALVLLGARLGRRLEAELFVPDVSARVGDVAADA